MTAEHHDPLRDLDELQELGGPSTEGEGADLVPAAADAWSAEQSFRALADVASTIASNLDFRSVLTEIVDVALHQVGASRGIVFLAGKKSGQLTPMVAVNVEGAELSEIERVSRTVLREASRGESVLSDDALSDPRFQDVPSVQANRIRTVVCVPMSHRGERVGVLYLDDPGASTPFPRHAVRFVSAFAGLAAVALENARLHGDLVHENARLRRRVGTLEAFGRIVTTDPGMQAVLERAAMVAQVDFPVLILGETGTGKELMARALHEAGPRALQPFVAYNCAAVPAELMESLFFGQVRGAFTGAVRDTPGLLRQADGGTLFLDEVGELNIALQAKLLRVLEDGMVRPVGSDREFSVDVRIVAATSRDLLEALRANEFREDLFYRLSVLDLRIPPLRERVGDIPILARHFLENGQVAGTGGAQVRLTRSAIELLQALPWTGNVRELESLVYRVAVFHGAGEVDADQVRQLLSAAGAGPPVPVEAEGTRMLTLEEQERRAIVQALERAGGNKSKAARFLGVHRNALLRRMEKQEITWDE